MTRGFADAAELLAAVGEHLGYSDWLTIDQVRIDAFAAATEDHQWIHVDPERAADGPYGATIAHGYLTLALVPALVRSVIDYVGWSTRVNYGSDKIRFPSPVPVGSQVRAGVQLLAVRQTATGLHVTNRVTVDIGRDGQPLPKPALIAETITLLLD